MRLTAFLTPSTPPSPMAWESGLPLAERSLSRTAGSSGLFLGYLKVPCSSSGCRLTATKLVKTWPAPSWMMAPVLSLAGAVLPLTNWMAPGRDRAALLSLSAASRRHGPSRRPTPSSNRCLRAPLPAALDDRHRRRGATHRRQHRQAAGVAAEATGSLSTHFRYDLNFGHFTALCSVTSWGHERRFKRKSRISAFPRLPTCRCSSS